MWEDRMEREQRLQSNRRQPYSRTNPPKSIQEEKAEAEQKARKAEHERKVKFHEDRDQELENYANKIPYIVGCGCLSLVVLVPVGIWGLFKFLSYFIEQTS